MWGRAQCELKQRNIAKERESWIFVGLLIAVAAEFPLKQDALTQEHKVFRIFYL